MAGVFQKFYADALDDPKLKRAARRGRKELELLPWLLLWARVHGENGRLSLDGEPADVEILADSFPGVTARRVKIALESLLAEKILTKEDDGVLRFTNWDERNLRYDSDSPEAVRERVRNHRNRKRAESRTTTDTEGTPAPVTPEAPAKGVTSDAVTGVTTVTRLEVEVEEEIEEEKERKTLPSVESRASRVVTDPAPATGRATPKPPASWPGRLAQVWTQHIGLVDPGRLGKALKPFVAAHGEALLARAIAHYGRTLLDEGRTRFASPEDFGRTAAQWIDDARPIGETVIGGGA